MDYLPDLDCEFDLAEALRWCWRHNAQLDFSVGEDNCPIVILVTPLLNPEGEIDKATSRCPTQMSVEDVVVDMVEKVRERVNLE